MRSFDTAPVRRLVATGAVLVGGGLALLGAGCTSPFTGPKLKPEDKAKFAKILQPAAMRVGNMAVDYLNAHPDELSSSVIPDEDRSNGFTVFVWGDKESNGYKDSDVEVSMLGKVVNGKLVKLFPKTTYDVQVHSTLDLGSKDSDSSGEIADPAASNKPAWFASRWSAYVKGKKYSGDIYADTGVDSPNDEDEIALDLDYARSLAQSIPDEAKTIIGK
jgi:hypothetical protein